MSNVSIKAAKYLARYLKLSQTSSISLKKYLYKIPEPGKRRKRVQRIIYGIYTYWNLLERLVTNAGLKNKRKFPYYMVAAFRIFFDKWDKKQLKEQLGEVLSDEEIKALLLAKIEFKDEIERLQFLYGYKRWFVEKLSKYIPINELERVLDGLNKRVPTWIVINTLRKEENDVVKMLEVEGYELAKDDEVPLLYKLIKLPRKIQESRAYKKGLVLPMQKASAAVTLFLNPQQGDLIYDSCAAPGIKTIFAIILSGGGARIIALDKSEERLQRMREFVKLYGVEKNVRIFHGDARFFNPKRNFDKALIDAPCTSTGTIPKNPDIKVKLSYDDVIMFSKLQYEILRSVFKIAPIDSEIVYATCSIFPEENELLIERLLNEVKNVRLIIPNIGTKPLIDNLGKRFWPHIHETIGMFYTKLVKI